MKSKWDDSLFNAWLKLREAFRNAKKDKNYNNIIQIGLDILKLDKTAKFIGIMTPLFNKDIANSYLKINDNENALKYYKLSLNGFIEYRKNNTLNKPTDWLKDIEILEKKINKLKTL
ncbi:MAG: hypothetical protein KAS92_02515 [Candidatus Omnitrophica bacterium]|nr:hypothetical protein [Candidatus Omnitrophota bacterium]